MPFDLLGGFQVGQQLAGKNAIGIMAENVLSRVNALQNVQLQARGAGLVEEEKLKGIARFRQTPEGQQYFSAIQGALPGFGAPTQAAPSASPNSLPSSYTPEYGMTGMTIDPYDPMAVKYTYGETPQSQMRRGIAEQVGKTQAERTNKLQIAQGQVGLIKSVLGTVPPISAASTPFSPLVATARAKGMHLAGTVAPRFADVESTLRQAVPTFVQAVGSISSGRLNNQELELMGTSLLQLPYLDDVSQQRRLGIIDQLLEKGGVPIHLGNQPSSPFQSVQPSTQELLAERVRRQQSRGF